MTKSGYSMNDNSVVKESLTTAVDGGTYSAVICGLVSVLEHDSCSFHHIWKISHDHMKQFANTCYEAFDESRRKSEAEQADADDLVELEKIQKRLDEKGGEE